MVNDVGAGQYREGLLIPAPQLDAKTEYEKVGDGQAVIQDLLVVWASAVFP